MEALDTIKRRTSPGHRVWSVLTRRRILQIAWPVILSNLSTPMLGLVDTAVIGHLGDPALIGAIAMGAMIFSFVFWGFGFLRMGTTGLVAQAAGSGDHEETKAALYRAVLLGTLIGVCLLCLQSPIASVVFRIVEGSAAVKTTAATYFDIRIWSAPASLINVSIVGFFLGLQRTRTTLVLHLVFNGTNILLDVLFVQGFGWGVAGVASASVIAEYLALALGIYFVVSHLRGSGLEFPIRRRRLLDWPALRRTLVVNRDIMVRTLCLIFAFSWFVNEGAAQGDVILASNSVLMLLVSFSAFFLDGFALTTESLVGRAVGSRDRVALREAISSSSQLAFVTALGISLAYFLFGELVVRLLTNVDAVHRVSEDYIGWAIAAPIVSVACYQLDGIFIGATRSREMRNAMVISLTLYLLAWWGLSTPYGNHGLWAALMVYFVARAVTLLLRLGSVVRAAEPEGDTAA